MRNRWLIILGFLTALVLVGYSLTYKKTLIQDNRSLWRHDLTAYADQSLFPPENPVPLFILPFNQYLLVQQQAYLLMLERETGKLLQKIPRPPLSHQYQLIATDDGISYLNYNTDTFQTLLQLDWPKAQTALPDLSPHYIGQTAFWSLPPNKSVSVAQPYCFRPLITRRDSLTLLQQDSLRVVFTPDQKLLYIDSILAVDSSYQHAPLVLWRPPHLMSIHQTTDSTYCRILQLSTGKHYHYSLPPRLPLFTLQWGLTHTHFWLQTAEHFFQWEIHTGQASAPFSTQSFLHTPALASPHLYFTTWAEEQLWLRAMHLEDWQHVQTLSEE